MGWTGGGQFDPGEDPISFLALSSANMGHAYEHATHVLIAVDQLDSDQSIDRLELLLNSGRHKVFIDSGIYSINAAYQREHPERTDSFGIPPNEMPGFDELRDRYVRICKRYEHALWGYVELDQGGYEWKPKTRSWLEGQGLRPIPVYHPLDDPYEYLDELMQTYDRVCFAVGARQTSWVRKRLLVTAYHRWLKYPNVWMHVLGIVPNQWFRALPFSSCDSSTWTEPMRFGLFHEQSDGKTISVLPRDFKYSYDSDPNAESGAQKATRLAMTQAHMVQRLYRARVGLMDEVGLPTQP